MAKVRLLDPTDGGRRLDRYELIGEIASGGMASVYLARLGGAGGFSRFVAIKRLHPHLANDPEFVEMFLNEARLAAGIHHPHVVPILEVGQSPSGYYLVMEYVEGDTLARLVARAITKGGRAGVVPRSVLMRILLDALAGLHAAHELCDPTGRPLGLVHRDVSPQNVLVGVDGSARITDFGVARATALLENTRPSSIKGKLAYMAPEQTRGEKIDRRADVFAMGIILWEVLANQRLFKAESDAATLARVLVEPVPPPSRIGRDVPAVFDAVALKALMRDPAMRYQTAAEMADALERAARAASPSFEGAVASPREVAEYVGRVIGDEIAAQRETVRAWLAQSERSQVIPTPHAQGGLKRDVTSKIPLDPGTGGARPDEVVTVPMHSVDPPTPATARGLGIVEPPPPGAPSASEADEPPPHSARTLVGPGPAWPETDEGEPTTVRAQSHTRPPATTPPLVVNAPLPPPPPVPSAAQATYDPDALSVPKPPMNRSRAPWVVAALLVLVVGAGILWARTQPTPEAATEPETSATQTSASLPASSSTAAATSDAVSPPPAPAPDAPPEASAAAEPAARPERPRSTGRGGKPKPAATAAPTAMPKPPDEGPGEDLSNPYR